MNKINIIQFSPYFPPHKWWIEIVAEEIWINWIKNDLWEFVNIITDFEQGTELEKNEKIIFENEVIWYKKDNVIHIVILSFDIINNFPMYKFCNKKTRLILKYLKWYIKENQDIRILTHTRFFLPSLFWWIFARKNKIKWIHIEHWSDYVNIRNKLNRKIAYFYDRIIGKWIFKKSDKVLAISEACKTFINTEFVDREVSVFYRWMNFEKNINFVKNWNIKLVFVWRLVKLKWVEDLIKAYKKLQIDNQLIIIWDWEERENLEAIKKWLNISFLWFKNKDFIIEYLSKNKCILINPSYQEWMPTTVIEWLFTKSVVVASNVWGTKEISNQDDLILFEAWNIENLKEKLIFAINNYYDLSWLSFDEVNLNFNRYRNIFNLYNLVK